MEDVLLLLPVEELLCVIDLLIGQGTDDRGQVGQLGDLVHLPLGSANDTDAKKKMCYICKDLAKPLQSYIQSSKQTFCCPRRFI